MPAVAGKKFIQAAVQGDVQQVPVIQPGALQLFVFNGKAHGPHQVQPRARGGAGACNVAGVLRNLRLHQHDVQLLQSSRFLFVHIRI